VLRCKLRVRCVPADRKTLLHQNTLDKLVDIVAQLWSGSRSKFIRRFGAGRAVHSYITLERVAQYIHTSLWSGSHRTFIHRFGAGRTEHSYIALERVAQNIHTLLWSGSHSTFIRRFGAGSTVHSYIALERVWFALESRRKGQGLGNEAGRGISRCCGGDLQLKMYR